MVGVWIAYSDSSSLIYLHFCILWVLLYDIILYDSYVSAQNDRDVDFTLNCSQNAYLNITYKSSKFPKFLYTCHVTLF